MTQGFICWLCGQQEQQEYSPYCPDCEALEHDRIERDAQLLADPDLFDREYRKIWERDMLREEYAREDAECEVLDDDIYLEVDDE